MTSTEVKNLRYTIVINKSTFDFFFFLVAETKLPHKPQYNLTSRFSVETNILKQANKDVYTFLSICVFCSHNCCGIDRRTAILKMCN